MKSVLGAAPATALLLSLGACATVIRGTNTDFKAASTPPGASVTTSTGFQCSPTPCVIRGMARKEAFDATFKLSGYKPLTRHVQSLVQGGGAAGAAGNVIAGGVIGIAVDATDGAMDDLVPNPLAVTLEPADATAPPAPPTTGTK